MKKSKILLSCLLMVAMFIGFVSCSDNDDNNNGSEPIINPFTDTYWGYVENYSDTIPQEEWIFHSIGFYTNTAANYRWSKLDVEQAIFVGTYTFSNNNFEMNYKNADSNIVKLSGTINGDKLTVVGILPNQTVTFEKALED